ncbi:hypothetical protein E2I00_002126, partial [Balaenoptera physalus]
TRQLNMRDERKKVGEGDDGKTNKACDVALSAANDHGPSPPAVRPHSLRRSPSWLVAVDSEPPGRDGESDLGGERRGQGRAAQSVTADTMVGPPRGVPGTGSLYSSRKCSRCGGVVPASVSYCCVTATSELRGCKLHTLACTSAIWAPLMTGQPGPGHGKKLGHRGVDASGETTYKKTTSSTLKGAIQLGIGYTVGNLSSKPERDVLMQDFYVVESIFFPRTAGHGRGGAGCFLNRGLSARDPVLTYSLCNEPLIELSNPGASGSLFYSGGKNIRVVVMNNVLPRVVKMHLKFDLKGSTYKRRASKKEKEKSIPTYKDLDFIQDMPEGLMLDADTFSALVKTLQRDCLPSGCNSRLGDGPRLDPGLATTLGRQLKGPDRAEAGGTRAGPELSRLAFIGFIKKLEHTWKALVHDGDTISVHRPSFYAERFFKFMSNTVFRKNSCECPGPLALKSSPSKKGRGALLAVKPLGPTAAFSASQIPSEREDAQYDLRGARSYPTLEDEGSPAPPRAVGSREPQVLAVPLPLRRDLGKMSLWLRSAALARVGLCAAGIPWGRCLLPSEVGVTGPVGTQLGLWGPAWLWQGLHLTPSPWLPLPLVPTLPGQGRARCTVPTCSDLAADGFHGVSVP